MNVFNYYSSFKNNVDRDIDVSEYLIKDDNTVKTELCDKIFNLMIYDTFVYYNRLHNDDKIIFENWLKENYSPGIEEYPKDGAYALDPFIGGRLYVDSNKFNEEDFFCLLTTYDFNIYFNEDYDLIIELDYEEDTTNNLYTLAMKVISAFINNIYEVKDECLNCCDKYYTLSKCYVLLKMIEELNRNGKKKEVDFYSKYLHCIIDKNYTYNLTNISEFWDAYTTDEDEQNLGVHYVKGEEPDEPVSDNIDNIILYLNMEDYPNICCITDLGEGYDSELVDGEIILSNLKYKYDLEIDSDNNIILT